MGITDALEEASEPLHLQQLQLMAGKLQEAQQQSDALTWVPETIPAFVQQAVKEALAATAEGPPQATHSQQQQMLPSSPGAPPSQQHSLHDAAPNFLTAEPYCCNDMPAGSFNFNDAAAGWDAPAGHGSPPAGMLCAEGLAGTGRLAGTAPHAAAGVTGALMGPDTAAAAPAASVAGPPLLAGSQVLRSSPAKRGSVSWVATSCLVPEGLPTAAAAEADGGQACMEVMCRVLVLQDCTPAAASPGLVKALSNVKWQEFGLSFTDFTASSSTEDTTGILTLGVLPHAVVVPLTMVVCSINSISSTDGAAPGAAGALGTAAQDTAADNTTTGKRQRGSSSAPQAPPVLSCKRETLLFTGALEDALLALKARLPAGYFQGKLEACVTGCVPPISTSLANIITRAANPQLHHQACQLLSCEPQQLHNALLDKLQEAASTALAAKAAVGSSRLQKQLQQQYRGFSSRSGNRAKAVAEAAAAVAAAAGDGTGGPGTDADDDGVSAQQQQEQLQQLCSWQLQLQGSTAGTEAEQEVQMKNGPQPSQALQRQQQLDRPRWPVHRPATSLAPQPDEQQQLQHGSSVVLPHPAAALWAGGGGSRKRGRRVAVLEKLHDTDEQQHAAATEQGEVLCWVEQCEPECQQQQQRQDEAIMLSRDQPKSCSSLEEQAAAERLGQQGALYDCKLRSSSAEEPAVAVRAADASGVAFAVFGSLMPGTGAAVPLQLGEAAEDAGTLSAQVAVEAGAGVAGIAAALADSKTAAAAVGGWRQRMQLPVGKRRVSGSAAASLF